MANSRSAGGRARVRFWCENEGRATPTVTGRGEWRGGRDVVRVVEDADGARGGFGLAAKELIREGAVVLELEGTLRPGPDRYSLQIAENLHLHAPAKPGPGSVEDRGIWRYLNHHCIPNLLFRGGAMVARRAILPGEELTFHYNSTELEMVAPFQCCCGGAGCPGKIGGFARLNRREQERLRPLLAEHLLRWLEARINSAGLDPGGG